MFVMKRNKEWYGDTVFFFKCIVSFIFSTSSKRVTVNLLLFFLIPTWNVRLFTFQNYIEHVTGTRRYNDYIFILYKKKYSLYIIIHKAHFAAILYLFRTVTSPEGFALKSSLKLFCDLFRFPTGPSTSKFWLIHPKQLITFVIYKKQPLICIYYLRYAICVEREVESLHLYVNANYLQFVFEKINSKFMNL